MCAGNNSLEHSPPRLQLQTQSERAAAASVGPSAYVKRKESGEETDASDNNEHSSGDLMDSQLAPNELVTLGTCSNDDHRRDCCQGERAPTETTKDAIRTAPAARRSFEATTGRAETDTIRSGQYRTAISCDGEPATAWAQSVDRPQEMPEEDDYYPREDINETGVTVHKLQRADQRLYSDGLGGDNTNLMQICGQHSTDRHRRRSVRRGRLCQQHMGIDEASEEGDTAEEPVARPQHRWDQGEGFESSLEIEIGETPEGFIGNSNQTEASNDDNGAGSNNPKGLDCCEAATRTIATNTTVAKECSCSSVSAPADLCAYEYDDDDNVAALRKQCVNKEQPTEQRQLQDTRNELDAGSRDSLSDVVHQNDRKTQQRQQQHRLQPVGYRPRLRSRRRRLISQSRCSGSQCDSQDLGSVAVLPNRPCPWCQAKKSHSIESRCHLGSDSDRPSHILSGDGNTNQQTYSCDCVDSNGEDCYSNDGTDRNIINTPMPCCTCCCGHSLPANKSF